MCEYTRLQFEVFALSACLSSMLAGLPQYDDDWKRRDVLGVHAQRQEGLYWVGACVPVGRLMAADMDELAHIAET